MPGETRQGQHGPLTPSRGGVPPTWIIVCLTCGFGADAHGATGDEALAAVEFTHDRSHKLIARPVDYTQPLFGRTRNAPHPFYS